MSGAHCGQEWDFNPTYNSGYEDGRKEAKARIADLEQQRDELQRQVTELASTIEQLANIGGPNGR